MGTPNLIRQTTRERATRKVTQAQIEYRKNNGHPLTGAELIWHGAGNGGGFFAAADYRAGEGDYYLSLGNEGNEPHESAVGDIAPGRAVKPIVRKAKRLV